MKLNNIDFGIGFNNEIVMGEKSEREVFLRKSL